jgi:hypothetical protein
MLLPERPMKLPISPRKYSQLLLFLHTTNCTVIILANSVPLIVGKSLRYKDQLMPFGKIMDIYSKTYIEYMKKQKLNCRYFKCKLGGVHVMLKGSKDLIFKVKLTGMYALTLTLLGSLADISIIFHIEAARL